MNHKQIKFTNRKNRRKGQGITEYAAIIAFVAVMVALTFSFAPGKLAPAISGAFSSCVNQLNNLSTASGGAS
ncbi:MAG: hypothetical protein IAF58_19750 [Leptolyngbya sp.]|nr:hypothetical protein [Candidatus Melainabacteria bacterium]